MGRHILSFTKTTPPPPRKTPTYPPPPPTWLHFTWNVDFNFRESTSFCVDLISRIVSQISDNVKCYTGEI